MDENRIISFIENNLSNDERLDVLDYLDNTQGAWDNTILKMEEYDKSIIMNAVEDEDEEENLPLLNSTSMIDNKKQSQHNIAAFNERKTNNLIFFKGSLQKEEDKEMSDEENEILFGETVISEEEELFLEKGFENLIQSIEKILDLLEDEK